MDYNFFDSDQPITVSRRRLPHWQQEGATYFVTFRTADSMPKAVLARWQQQQRDWLQQQGVDASELDLQILIQQLPKEFIMHFDRASCQSFERLLDECHGACPLRSPDIARVVYDSLMFFHGTRYQMGDFVIMPNHVHLLIAMRSDTDLLAQCTSWKRFTAREINRRLGTTGRFWQAEQFDHLVRSAEHYEKFQHYISDNPRSAGLRDGEYMLHRAT